MTTVLGNFQSFLIIGTKENRLVERQLLVEHLGLDLQANSPDVSFIQAAKTLSGHQNSSISIDQIRILKKHIFQKPVKSKYKLIIIDQAHKLTLVAQNALLKILEEPPSHAILILEAENEFQLLPTIISRVVKIKSGQTPKDKNSQNFLERELLANLQSINSADAATGYLDEQIIGLYKKLLESTKTQNISIVKKIKNTILLCVTSKKMIAANVNPRFVLANLFLSTQT